MLLVNVSNRMITKSFFLKNFDRSKELIPLSYNDVFSAVNQFLKSYTDVNDIDIIEENLIEDPVFELDVLELLNEDPMLLLDSKNPRVQEAKIIANKAKKNIKDYFNLPIFFDTDSLDKNVSVYQKAELTEKKIQEIITSKKSAIIFKPIFEIEDCLIQPDAIIVHEKGLCEFVVIKATTNTKRKYFLEIIYDFVLFKKIGKYKLLNYYFCTVKYELQNKNNVSFFLNTEIKTSKNSFSLSSKEKDYFKNKPFNHPEKIAYIHKKKSNGVNGFLIVKLIDNLIKNNIVDLNKISDFVTKEIDSKSVRNIQPLIKNAAKIQINFWDQIQDIKKYQELKINQIVFNYSENFDSFWSNYLLRNLIKLVFAHKYNEIFKLSGKLANWSQLTYAYKENKSITINQLLHELNQKKSKANFNNSTNKISFFLEAWNSEKGFAIGNKFKNTWNKLKKKKVYFDFETISSSIRIINNSLPFSQIVTQCSLIVDKNEIDDKRKLNCENLIFDPLFISVNDFKKVIDSLYQNNCSDYSFVVFNKSFEKNRLLEMATLINEQIYKEKVKAIVDNLFDLADIFTIENNCLAFKQLNGFSSIKKVLTIIDESFLKASKSIGYQNLKIQKGDVAQEVALSRFLNCLNKNEWNRVAFELKKYCENDVRAMISIVLFIQDLIKKNDLFTFYSEN